jgi:S-DNA-T family DNA segregation ATPase FtsK/SpoIIIE
MARPWGERIIASLNQFGVEAELADILIGPTVIQFRVQPLPGVKVNRIVSLSNDLAMTLAVASLRVEAPIPGLPYVGIEIPNPKRRGITLRSIIEEDAYQGTDRTLPLPMGVTINGDPLIIGLEDLPHLLVAGTTGSGKSVFVNACIVGLCSMRRPDELKMALVDPKRVEMAIYEKLPHILTPPVTDPKKAVHVLGWAIREMERRYSLFAAARVRNLSSYNEITIPKERLPNIVIVVDELADLMMTAAKEVEEYICRLAQMARATGIHLMLATQRPSVNVITGLIKANVPARVAFTLPSMMDSRTIIDSSGAEKLLGKGDMLFLSTHSPKPVRVQSPWIDERSISRWLEYLINMFGEPVYTDIDEQGEAPAGFEENGGFDDPLLEEAVKVVLASGMASASGLQRRLRVGFTRAGRIVDMMESAGIIGPADGAHPREILVDEDGANEILERLGVAK